MGIRVCWHGLTVCCWLPGQECTSMRAGTFDVQSLALEIFRICLEYKFQQLFWKKKKEQFQKLQKHFTKF